MPFNFDTIPWIRDQQRRNPIQAPGLEEPTLPPLPREQKAIITEPDWLSWLPENAETEQDKHAREQRRKQIGERYLAGRGAPLILSASLKGPFDKSSGWVNPWLPRDPKNENGKPVGIHGIHALKALRGDSSAARSAKRRRTDNVASVRRISNLSDFPSIGGIDTGVKVPAAKPNLHGGLKSFMPSTLGNAPGSARKLSGDSAVTASGNKRPSDNSWLKGANIVRRKRKELPKIPSPTPPSRLNGSTRTSFTPQNLLERFREHKDATFTQEEPTLQAMQGPVPKSPQKTAVTPEPYSPPFGKWKRSMRKEDLILQPVSGSAFYGKVPTQDNTVQAVKKSKLRAEGHGSSSASSIHEPGIEPESSPRPRGPRPQIESSIEAAPELAVVERLQEQESYQYLEICPVNTILKQELDFKDLVPHLIAGHLARAAEYVPPGNQEAISTLGFTKRTETSAPQGGKLSVPEKEVLLGLPQALIKPRPEISSDSDPQLISAVENDAVAEEPFRSPRPKKRPLDQFRPPSPPGSFKFRSTKRNYLRKSSGMLKQALNTGVRINSEQDGAQSPGRKQEEQLPNAPSTSPEDIVGMMHDAYDAREDTALAMSPKRLSKPSPLTARSRPSREPTVMVERSTIIYASQDTCADATISTQPSRPEGEPETQDWPGEFSFVKQYVEVPDQGKDNAIDDEAPMNTATTSTTSMLISAAMAELRGQEMNEDEADVTIKGLPKTTFAGTGDALQFNEAEKTPAMREDAANVSLPLMMEEDEIAVLPQASAPDAVMDPDTQEWPGLDISFTQKSVPEVAVEEEEEAQEEQDTQDTQDSYTRENERTIVQSILKHVGEVTKQRSQSQTETSPMLSHENEESKYEASKYFEHSQEEERFCQEVRKPSGIAAALAAPQGKSLVSLDYTGEGKSSITYASQCASGSASGTTSSRSMDEQCAQRTDAFEYDVQHEDEDMLLDEPASPVREPGQDQEQTSGQLHSSQLEAVKSSDGKPLQPLHKSDEVQRIVAAMDLDHDEDADDNWQTILFSQASHVPETSFPSQQEPSQPDIDVQVRNSADEQKLQPLKQVSDGDHVVPSSMVSIEQQTYSDKQATSRPQAAINAEELVSTQEDSSQVAATAIFEDNHPAEPTIATDSPAVAQSPWHKDSPTFTRAQTEIPKPVQTYGKFGHFTMSQSHVAARLFVAASQPALSPSLVLSTQSRPRAVNTDDRGVIVVPNSGETAPALPPQKNMVGEQLPLPSTPYFSAPIAKMAPTPSPSKAEKTWPHVSPLKPGEVFMSFDNPWARGTQVAATEPGNSQTQSRKLSQSQRNGDGKHRKRVSFSLSPSDDDKENGAESDDDDLKLPAAKKQRVGSSPPVRMSKSKSPHLSRGLSSPSPPLPPLEEPSNLDSDDAFPTKLKLVGLRHIGNVEKENVPATSSPGGIAKAFLEADKMVQKSSALSNVSNTSNVAVKGSAHSSPPHAPAPSAIRERQSSVVRNLAILYPSSDEESNDDAPVLCKRSRSRSRSTSKTSQPLSERFRSQESFQRKSPAPIIDPFANPWNSETPPGEPEISDPVPVEEEDEYDWEEPAPFALGSIMGMLGKDFSSQSNVGIQDESEGVGEVVDQMSDLLDTWDVEEELRKERRQSGQVTERKSTARERIGWRGY